MKWQVIVLGSSSLLAIIVAVPGPTSTNTAPPTHAPPVVHSGFFPGHSSRPKRMGSLFIFVRFLIAVLAMFHFVGWPGPITSFMLADLSIAMSTLGAIVTAPSSWPPQPQRPLSQ